MSSMSGASSSLSMKGKDIEAVAETNRKAVELTSVVIHGEATENKGQPMSSMNGASSSLSIKDKDIEAVAETNRKAVELSSIVIHGEATENKGQPMPSMNGASSSLSVKRKDIEAVVPDKGAEFRMQEVISFTSRSIEDILSNRERIRNSVRFFPARQLPGTIGNFSSRYMIPEIVSIGPLRKSFDLPDFEECKQFFLLKFLRRCERGHRDLEKLLVEILSLEARTRYFYSDHEWISVMSSEDLIQMMLLDGSFLIELLCYFSRDDEPILVRRSLIPLLVRDVLKFENHLPLFVLTTLFGESDEKFTKVVLEFFDLFWKGPRTNLLSELSNCSHLLELFYWSSVKPLSHNHSNDQNYASTHSMQCVTELKRSGIKFKQSEEAESFLDIKFKNGILEIPTVTFNEMFKTVLINCAAFEESQDCHIKYFNNYLCFFSCLISQASDVSSLFLDGIISDFSDDDRNIADFFKELGRNTQCVRDSYLADEIKNVEAYYNSDRARLMRNYFTTKWNVLKVSVTSLLLMLALIQTLMSVLSYILDLK